jgi:hypothetical protein
MRVRLHSGYMTSVGHAKNQITIPLSPRVGEAQDVVKKRQGIRVMNLLKVEALGLGLCKE